MRSINGIHLTITTACDRICPDCCCNTGRRPVVHYPWDYFEQAAQILGPIERLRLTGGEPTCHPDFTEMVPRFKELFGCNRLEIETNGFRLREADSVLDHFDWIWLSWYGAEGLAGSAPGDNTGVVEWVRERRNGLGLTVLDMRQGFTPRARRGDGSVCNRGRYDILALYDGKLWGCCAAPGVPQAQGRELTPDWRDWPDLPLPCGNCWFSAE